MRARGTLLAALVLTGVVWTVVFRETRLGDERRRALEAEHAARCGCPAATCDMPCSTCCSPSTCSMTQDPTCR